ncbi:STAS domain-containing protein [Streptomyces collinus]
MPSQQPNSPAETGDAKFVNGEIPASLPVPHGAASVGRLSIRPEGELRLRSRLVLCLEGELDVDTAAELRECLATLAARSEGGLLLLDLSGITFCDSACLYTLLGIRRTLPLAGIEVVYTNMSAVVRAAAGRAGLISLLGLHEDL